MTALPWSKFFWDDWESDEALKMCSPGAQALWMRMLCVCAKAGGYLEIAGRKLSADDMTRLTGWVAEDVRSWWDELKRWGVYSAEGRGRIYCRRMVKDARKAAIARENGKNGGNPNLRKHGGFSASDNQRATDKPTDRSGRSQKPEARVQLELVTPTSEKPEPQQSGEVSPSRGSRLKPDWQPSADNLAYAVAQGYSLAEVSRIAEDFRDFWSAKAGKDASKLDWTATWRRWVREEGKRRLRGRQAGPQRRVGFV